LNIYLTDDNMAKLFAPQNMFSQIYKSQASLCYKLYQNDSSNVFSPEILWLRQWGNSSIFKDDRLYLSPSVPHVQDFRDLDPKNIIGHGEYSYYLENVLKSQDPPYIAVRTAATLFKLDINPQTLMNPANLQVFYDQYRSGNYPSITKRFGVNQEQIYALVGYFEMINKDQILLSDIGGSYEKSVFAKLIIKTMNASYYDLQQELPFEVASRYLGGYINLAGLNCSYYINLAINSTNRTDEICMNVSL